MSTAQLSHWDLATWWLFGKGGQPMKSVAIIQARMGSSRLPGKVLMEVAGKPMLALVAERIGSAHSVDEVVVATSTEPADDPIWQFCSQQSLVCYRGSLEDVLDRFYQAAVQQQAELVLRITADCPLIDGALVDHVVGEMQREPRADYATNDLPPLTYPIGLSVEAFTMEALTVAWREDDNSQGWREHVTPFIYNHRDRFRVRVVQYPTDHSQMRWTVDTEQDLQLIRRVYEHFGGDDFVWTDVLAAFLDNPQWSQINQDVAQKPIPVE